MSLFDNRYREPLLLLQNLWFERSGVVWSGTDLVWTSLFHVGEDPARAEYILTSPYVISPKMISHPECWHKTQFGVERRNCGELRNPLFPPALCLRSLWGWSTAVRLSAGFEWDLCNPQGTWEVVPGASSTAFREIQRWCSLGGLLCIVVVVIVMHRHGSDKFCTADLFNVYRPAAHWGFLSLFPLKNEGNNFFFYLHWKIASRMV